VVLSLLGRIYTWFQPNGGAMSRLDRFLVSDGWGDAWGVATQWALPRDVSDHCPIILRYSSQLWGPKPFRFNNFWLEHREFVQAVRTSWECQMPPRWMAYNLKEKLKYLKRDLKVWSRETFGNLDHRIHLLVEFLQDMDLKAELGSITLREREESVQGFVDLWELLKSKDSHLFQRSRSRWLKEGDANTTYFHASVKLRRKRNSILVLRFDDRWVESVEDVRTEIVSYFSNHFAETLVDRPQLDGVNFNGRSEEEDLALSVSFQSAEIKEVVLKADGNKSPGDGFNFSFFKKCWDLMEREVGTMFDEFHAAATLPTSYSSFFLTLIPQGGVASVLK